MIPGLVHRGRRLLRPCRPKHCGKVTNRLSRRLHRLGRHGRRHVGRTVTAKRSLKKARKFARFGAGFYRGCRRARRKAARREPLVLVVRASGLGRTADVWLFLPRRSRNRRTNGLPGRCRMKPRVFSSDTQGRHGLNRRRRLFGSDRRFRWRVEISQQLCD